MSVSKVTVGLQAALSVYLYKCAFVWDVVVAGTFVVTLVPACAGVSTFTLVGTTVVPLVSLAVLDALVGTLVEEATSLCARTTVAARFSAVLHGPGSVVVPTGVDAVVRAVRQIVCTRWRHCLVGGHAYCAGSGTERGSPEQVSGAH